jgi:hypothetical protein
MYQLEQIPSVRGARPAGSRTVTREAVKGSGKLTFERRTVLRAAVTGITAVGISALGVFPAARRAYADGRDVWDGACPAYAQNHDCSPGCGPSRVDPNACRSDGFHRYDSLDSFNWYSIRPNQCTVLMPTADGWTWRYDGSCMGCLWIKYRCMDGWFTTCYEQCWTSATICRWIVGCGRV